MGHFYGAEGYGFVYEDFATSLAQGIQGNNHVNKVTAFSYAARSGLGTGTTVSRCESA
ncbi:MAG: hypothetical protein JRF02_00860 [Deltaproteobacteria bacterium]|nr:hypothetical protein [Deltaproteobacteria bacterium]